MTKLHNWNTNTGPLNILCIRLDNFGDVLMTTPAFRALKHTWPTCRITLLTSSVGAAVASMISEIDQVLVFNVPWVKAGHAAKPAGRPDSAVLEMAEILRQHSFDQAIIFTVQSQNPLPAAMLCYLAGIPRVLGYCRENPYQLLTDWVPDPEVLVATRHEVERQLDLVAAIGCHTPNVHLSVKLPDGVQERAMQQLAKAGVDMSRPWLVLHPGVSEEKRRYPAAQFVEAARQLALTQDFQIVLTGSATEWTYVESICQQINNQAGKRAFNLAGTMDLATLAGLLAESPVLIANNTGPVHLAAAVGTPAVVLYAKTNPQHTPWQVPSRVLYFDVPPELRSRNSLLQQFPDTAGPAASSETIVLAVEDLVRLPHQSRFTTQEAA